MSTSKTSMNRILNGKVNFPLCLAPMVGLSHAPLRGVLREYMPQNATTLWPTEMLNSRRLPNEKVGRTPESFHPQEDNLVPQILGNDESAIAASVQALEQNGASGIDINMGCPVDKALRHNYGVALMGDPEYAAQVVKFTARNARGPVSVKLRAGLSQDLEFLRNFTNSLVQAGASWLTLHPRLATQKRRGSADWQQIRWLKSQLDVPLIGNGDIQCVEDVLQMLEQTGCDMVMSGRALAAKPWMLWQLGEKMGWAPPQGKIGLAPSGAVAEASEYGRSLLRLLHYFRKYYLEDLRVSEDLCLRKFRFHVRTTAVWLDFGSTLESEMARVHSLTMAEDAVSRFFEQDLNMYARTDLRQ